MLTGKISVISFMSDFVITFNFNNDTYDAIIVAIIPITKLISKLYKMYPITIGTTNTRTRSFQKISMPILRATIIDMIRPASDPTVNATDAPTDP